MWYDYSMAENNKNSGIVDDAELMGEAIRNMFAGNYGRTVSETISNVEIGNFVGGMDNKPLLRSFLKYFTQTPANILRSVDFGKSLFRYFAPDVEIPNDPASLLNATRSLFTVGFADAKLTDEAFVRFMLNKIDKEPDLITFDMVADLVESNAYKNFGKTAQDKNNKQKFERWIYDQSLLSKIEQCPAVDVVLNQEGMTRVINAIAPSKKKQNIDYLNQINAKVKDFDETYVQNVNDKALKDLKKIAKNTANKDYVTQLKNVYGILCDREKADLICDVIDGGTIGAESKVRNSMIMGFGMEANKMMLAVSQRKNWSEKDFNDIYLKFPIEKRAEKLEEQAQLRNTPKKQATSATQQAAIQQDYLTSQQEYEALLGTKPNLGQAATTAGQNNIAPEKAKFNPVFDVVKTFGGTLAGATVISTITSIPGVGQVVGPVLGLATVATAGIGSAVSAYNKAKKHGEVSKSDAKKIAIQSGIAMLGKAWPYAAAMALGPAGRILGSGVVLAKTFYADLERRAGLQQEKTKGLIGKLKRVVEAGRTAGGVEVFKSALYSVAKGAAVLVGGTVGSEIGSSIGSNVSFENGPHLDKEGVVEDLKQTKVGKLFGRFKGLRGNEQAPMENLHPAGVDNGMSQSSSGNIQLSEDNLEKLSQIGEVKLTEHARMTVHADNHRQYVGGVQQDWYNSAQEETAMQTLRDAGVEDPAGVLRKAGSMARFFGGKYKTTLDNLCSGNCTDKDVDNIFDALRQINDEGGLGEIEIVKQPTYQTYEPVQEPVTTTEVPAHTQEYRTPASEVTDDLSATRFVPDEVTADPIDVPPHTQEYRTPNTVEVAETHETQESPYEGVDIDNSVDYIAEDNQFTNLDIPPHTQDYRTPNDSLTSEPTSIPIPSHTMEYTVSGVMDGEFQDVTYGGNDGENDYFIDNQGNEITTSNSSDETETEAESANEPAMLSDEQMARIRASWIRSGELSQNGLGEYLASLNNEELHSTLNYLSDEELASINNMIPEPTVDSQKTNLPNTDLDSERFDDKYYENLRDSIETETEMKYGKSDNAMEENQRKAYETQAAVLNQVNIDNYQMSGSYESGYNYTNSGMTDRSSVLSAIREHNQSLNDEPTMER